MISQIIPASKSELMLELLWDGAHTVQMAEYTSVKCDVHCPGYIA